MTSVLMLLVSYLEFATVLLLVFGLAALYERLARNRPRAAWTTGATTARGTSDVSQDD